MTDSAINLLTDLEAIDPVTYEQAEAYILQLLREKFPDRDFGPGRGLHWLIGVPGAATAAAQLANARLVTNGLNLSAIKTDPDQANEDLADLLLSNYYVERQEGSVSSGNVTYVVRNGVSYVIPAGTILTAEDNEYEVPESIYVYTTEAEVTKTTDRYLRPRDDGNFEFTVPVQAIEVGVNTYLPRGTVMSVQDPPPSFLQAITTTDVSGGSNDETLADLISQVGRKFAASTWGSTATIRGLITELYPQANVWITGFGDDELLRDKHNPLAVASGGFADVWVSTSDNLTEEELEVEAELVDDVKMTWRIVLGTDAASGVYDVTDIRMAGGTTPLEKTLFTRGYQTPTTGYRPLIFDAPEAAFSSYQTITLEFTDVAQSTSGLTVGAKQAYNLVLLRMAAIKELNDQLVANDFINPVTNDLVKGVVPCQASISLQVRLLDGDFESAIDVSGMKQSIINAIAGIDLGYGVLSSSVIMDAVHNYLSGRSDIGATTVTLRGDIIAPTDERMVLGDSREIRIPNLPEKMVTARTTKFFTNVDLIDIQFARVDV